VVVTQDVYPFGEDAGASPAALDDKHRFTGYERDAETGIDYAMNRHYVSANGRFMQPDVLSGSIGNPQSLNRYSYSLNDPKNLSDPSGLQYVDGGPDGPPPGWGPPPVWGPTWGPYNWTPDQGYIVPPTETLTWGPPDEFQSWGNFSMTTYWGGPMPSGFSGSNAGAGGKTPSAADCLTKITNALNNFLHINVIPLGPTAMTPKQQDPRLGPGGRNGAYNFNFFAPNEIGSPPIDPLRDTTGNRSGRVPNSGLHIPPPGGQDPVLPNFGPGTYMGMSGFYFTAHYDSANGLEDLKGVFTHLLVDVILRRPHGC